MLTSSKAAQRSALAGHAFSPRFAAALVACAVALLLGLSPTTSNACACGCGVFDVGTASMFPQHAGGMVYLEYDYMDQNKNWSGTSRAPADNNEDKRIRTSFMNVGLHYQFDRAWGVQVELPYWKRYFQTTDPDTGDLVDFTHGAVGDVRLKGVYTGFSDDMSTGITFGLKLPTGDSTYANFDPDTEIGSGSTGALLGAYHLGNIDSEGKWRYFLQAQWEQTIAHKAAYRPGNELVAVAGAYYEGWNVSPSVKIAPVVQLNASYRGHDGGDLGHPEDSGYTRLLVTPGIEVDAGKFTAYVDVGLPVLVNASGNQLVSSQFWRANLSYHF
jgi:hypothetical protein